jgi:RimJ/RimL family protein N-acetyltransferase
MEVLGADELTDEQWHELAVAAGSDARRAASVERIYARRDSLDRRSLLVAIDGGAVIGRLAGRFLDDNTYRVIELTSVGPYAERVASALVGALRESFRRDGVRILAMAEPRDAVVRRALDEAGFRVAFSKALYRRDLDGYRSPHRDPLVYRAFDESSREEFASALRAATQGDPLAAFSTDAETTLEHFIQLAGSAFDPHRWQIARLDDAIVGVVLPQVFADAPDEGTIYHIGVLPAFRGRGFGTLLHAAGLEILAREVGSYVGSTHTDNHAMAAVFERNGCRRTTTQHFYEP